MKKFMIDPSFWELFPEGCLAVLVVKDLCEEISESEQQEIVKLLETANSEAKKYLPSEVISENPVVAVWRKAYQQFPTKKGARCSLENLLKRVLHGNPVTSIAPSVDITNAVSLEYAFPIGAEDLDTFAGDLHLGRMQGGESFLPLGSEKEEPPLAGEVGYYDEAGAVCRCLNWRDGQRTAVSEKTTTEFIVMECVEPERREELEKALQELSELLQKYLKATVLQKAVLDKDTNEIVLG
ncbi:MAG: hypothetical protein IKE21_09725 [Erysipelotrichaceae bacterium]|nr:hypothetical protein [Erysipelotrichaceae bacterium]